MNRNRELEKEIRKGTPCSLLKIRCLFPPGRVSVF
jgi:hypothetical protein